MESQAIVSTNSLNFVVHEEGIVDVDLENPPQQYGAMEGRKFSQILNEKSCCSKLAIELSRPVYQYSCCTLLSFSSMLVGMVGAHSDNQGIVVISSVVAVVSTVTFFTSAVYTFNSCCRGEE
jgi:hypothetical protein